MTRRLFLGMCLAAACGSGSEDTERWTVAVDTLSSGPLHVMNDPPASGPKATLMAREVLRIGAQNSGAPSRSAWFDRLPHSRMVVSQSWIA